MEGGTMMKRKVKLIYVIILSALICFVVYFIRGIVYPRYYLSCYQDIALSPITHCSCPSLAIAPKFWTVLRDQEMIERYETKYDVIIGNIDTDKEMIIVSFNAELKSIDYNRLEKSHYQEKHIGYPQFGDFEPNKLYFYKAEKVPIIHTEVAGFLPGYNGQYRERTKVDVPFLSQ